MSLVVPFRFIAALALSTGVVWCVYNLYFHPYAKYPGPLLAKVSPFYGLYHAYKGDLHLDVLHCHEHYGTFVRYSPNRLLVNSTGGLKAIYGSGNNFSKSKGYAPHPYFPSVSNSHNCIDKQSHARKRRVVAEGFSASAMSAYEPYILGHIRTLCSRLIDDADASGWSKPKDMAVWTNYFTLDVISDMTFGRSFNMLEDESLRWIVEAIVDGNRHIYMRFAWPWLFSFNPRGWLAPARWLFPKLVQERGGFVEVANQYARDRMFAMQVGKSERQDILSTLLESRDPKTEDKLSRDEVWSEVHLMIAAGGDTISTAISAVFFYLAFNEPAYSKLAQEIRSTFDNVEAIHRGPKLSSCTYLKACIDESLRLTPSTPGALWREAGPGGALIDGEYIPAGIEAATCTYALHHEAKYFHHPFEFRPERFLEAETAASHLPDERYRGNDTLDASAPFSIGPRNCPAKSLAYLELMLAVSRILWLMDFEAVSDLGAGGPGKGRGRERRTEFQMIDQFSSNKQGPLLRFCRRQRDG